MSKDDDIVTVMSLKELYAVLDTHIAELEGAMIMAQATKPKFQLVVNNGKTKL